MKRLPTLLGLLIILLPFSMGSCSSGGGASTFSRPSSLMKQYIQEKIEQIPYQHGEELILNLQWLAQSGEQSIPQLAKSLNHKIPKTRSSVAWVLGQIGNKKAVKLLRRHTNDSQPVVRFEIARALLVLGDFSRITELIRGLESGMQGVRYHCFEILTKKTGKSFDYDYRSKDVVSRKAAAAKWSKWWHTQDSDEWFRREENASLAGPGK